MIVTIIAMGDNHNNIQNDVHDGNSIHIRRHEDLFRYEIKKKKMSEKSGKFFIFLQLTV